MPRPLPKKLGRSPLVEAVCELRLVPAVPLHTGLPDYLTSRFPGETGAIETVSAAGPADGGSPRASAVRIAWRSYSVLVSARSVTLACGVPYAGWAKYRVDALELFHSVLLSSFFMGIERYSMKYIHFFASPDGRTGFTDMLDWDVRIGPFAAANPVIQVRVEIPQDDLVTVLSVASPAEVARFGESAKVGGIIDVDTICNHATGNIPRFGGELAARLDHMRRVNKRAFFDCLRSEAIDRLEPEYDAEAGPKRLLH
jgi:uncharacterized protein (TIGR04255 family)